MVYVLQCKDGYQLSACYSECLISALTYYPIYGNEEKRPNYQTIRSMLWNVNALRSWVYMCISE